MAGDWIPMRCDLPDEEEVIGMASILNVDQDTVAGKLLRLWGWANRTSKDGKVSNITPGWIDKKVGIPGFAGAMITVGWLLFDGDAVYFPNFDRWNSKSAKKRLQAATRKRLSRSKCDKSVTREEKRREEKSKEEKEVCSEPAHRVSEPTPDEVFLEFPCLPGHGRHGMIWPLTQSKVAEYVTSFPGIDVRAESRRALQWCRDNPAKRKTYKGMGAFLVRWFSRAQDRLPEGSYGPRREVRSLARVESPAGKYTNHPRTIVAGSSAPEGAERSSGVAGAGPQDSGNCAATP